MLHLHPSTTRLGFGLAAFAAFSLTLGGSFGTGSVHTLAGMQAAAAQTNDAGGQKKKRHRPSEIFNQFDTPPPASGPQPSSFTIVLGGNLVTAICGATNPPCLDQPVYGPYNPFCPPSQGPNNPCYPTVVYNPSNNTTTVTYSGNTLTLNEPGYPGLVHFGLLSTPSQPGTVEGDVLNSYWSFPPQSRSRRHRGGHQSTSPSPMVNIAWDSKVQESANWAYAEVFVAVSLTPSGPAVYGTWNQVAYIPKGTAQPKLTFANYGSQTLYVVAAGIIPNQQVPTDPECLTNPSCPEDMSILEALNFAGSPPPGYSGSNFIPLTYPPAKVLKPQKPPM